MDNWMKCHPGQTMTIYDIPGIVAEAFPKATTPTNIMSGFRVSGIWPFNRDIFEDHEFSPASVTDRPLTPTETNVGDNSENKEDEQVDYVAVPGPSSAPDFPSANDELNNSFRVLQDIRPLPKATNAPKKVTKRRKNAAPFLPTLLKNKCLKKSKN